MPENWHCNPHLDAYFDRIKFPRTADGSLPAPTLETLYTLHTQHVLNIPCENLSFIHHKLKAKERPIDFEALHKRIVHGGRGGMCQEMNSLLHHYLKMLGFDCYSGMAYVVTAGSFKRSEKPLQGLVTSKNLGSTVDVMRSHQIIFTKIDGHWYLCDVGFGGTGITEPLLLHAYDDPSPDTSKPLPGAAAAAEAGCPGESHMFGTKYRLRRGVIGSGELLSAEQAASHPEAETHVGWYLQALINESWVDQYYFTRNMVIQPIMKACAEASFRSHPLFTKQLVVAMPLRDGHLTLVDFTFKVRRKGQPTEERQLASEEERDALLADMFGINMNYEVPA